MFISNALSQAGGTTRQSFVKELLGRHMDKDNKITVEDEEMVKEIAANLFFCAFSAVTAR